MRRFLILLALLLPLPLFAVDIHDTRLLSEPAVSADRIAFAYANDLWVANLDGSGVRRLTSHPGIESGPKFSPDGKLIAFTGRYEGNTDVYVVPAEGGVPRRLTWHPQADVARGFTADGAAVLFSSPREVYTGRYLQLYTVPVGGGAATKLPIPHATKAAYSPDGRKIVYQPLGDPYVEWKHYRGGQVARLVLFDVATYATESIPQPAGRCNDTDPMWVGDKVYFRSDRDGEFNVYSFDPATKKIARLTKHADFPVVNASAGAGKIVYEQAGYLHLLDPKSGSDARLKVGVAADLVESLPRFAKGKKFIRTGSISPSGARAAVEFRGEIFTVPREKGDDRNLTNTPAANERWPAWSPDGKSIAYFSDRDGEYQLYIADQEGKGTPREIKIKGAGSYQEPKWSPDSKKISFSDNSRTIFVVDVATGELTKVSSDVMYGPVRILNHAWSPDSQWLAYTRNTPTYMNRIYLYSVADKTSTPLTDPYTDAMQPVFDANGKYLYFFASTDAGPVDDWFAQSNEDIRATRSIYLAVLPKGVVSPLAKESDEEAAKPDADKEKKEEKKAPVKVAIDFDGITQRIVALPPKAAEYDNLAAGKSGQIYYTKSSSGPGDDEATLQRFDLEKRKEESLADKVQGFELSADAKRMLLVTKDGWSLVDAGEKLDLTKFRLPVDKLQVKIDPRAEWRQIFEEAWRINRDFFYDPNMHGADWNAMKAKYEVFLPDLAVRQDLNRVMTWMSSELSVGHHRLGGGDSLAEVESVPGGLLGADYKVENGRYRFAKVYGGLNWNPELRAPLTEPGVDVKAGDYLLAVGGKDLKYPEDLYSRFEQTAGRIVELTVGPNADGSGSRVVKVVPIEDEAPLRNRDWVEGNLRKVTEATNGKVAYVYVPNTAGAGYTYFKRYFFPQADRDAVIVDERHNGGGAVADYYIDILRRPLISHWAMRYGGDLKTPLASIQGPKVMIIDETAGSGGDLLPWMFHKLQLGTLVGTRTWGGLVGILGFPVLMDGGTITAPNLGIWTSEGFIVENEGVPPDVEVEQTPADVIAGRDPQLERAIAIAMKQLAENPPKKETRPPFPVRAPSAMH
ncbi:MAG TPA: PDZ domain-containing protein [Thermoanaerobaculia bacterium]|nr:PDZ domain-containing protein [Thermoanaerobaculia bacterium]